MESRDIITYVENLKWDKPQEKQEEAICVLSELDERYYTLIFDKTQKSTWENAVKVIEKIDFPKNVFFIPSLLWLLQDVNWPGALRALNILARFNKMILAPQLEQRIREAYEQEDYMWLGGLKMLVEKGGYKNQDFMDDKTYSLLDFSDF